MRRSIRSQLLAVAVLGLVTCVLALYALGRPISMANTQRVERSREGVIAEVQRLQGRRATDAAHPSSAMFGMQSGLLARNQSLENMQPPLEPSVREVVARAIEGASSRGGVFEVEEPIGDDMAFVAAVPGAENQIAWAAYVMRPPKWTPILRTVGLFIAVASFGLVLLALYSVSSVQRGARAIVGALDALRTDLSAPVPRPAIQELREISEGVAGLATALSSAQAKLAERERLAVLGRVTAGVAHELRNPLASIKLRVDVASRNPDAPPELVGELHETAEEVARLDRLVNDLLVVAGRRPGPLGEIELGAFARRRATLMQDFADGRGVKVRVSGNALVNVDGDAIARAIDNLLRNAIEASPSGSEVRVEVDSGEKGIRVRVVDMGPGVSTERAGELFEPFFTTKLHGVGLGLALSHAIAAAHGGVLRYAREGSTTVFELLLPRSEAVT